MIELKYRTFWRRFFAGIVDGLIIFPIYFLHKYIWASFQEMPSIVVVLWFIFYWTFYYIYSVCFHGKYGKTIGKMIAKVKVVKLSEKNISYKIALLRDIVPIFLISIDLAYLIPKIFNKINPFSEPTLYLYLLFINLISTFWFLLEIVTMLSNKKRRAIHDYIAGTVVIRIP